MKYLENKQMDLTDRLVIEIGVNVKNTLKAIAKELHRHPSTISRELRENRTFIRGDYIMGNDCVLARRCFKKRHMCHNNYCNNICIACRSWNCHEHCDKYVRRHCGKTALPPYVCNDCSEKRYCSQDRYIYSAKYAQQYSDARRSESRRGIRISNEQKNALNELLAPRIKSGQPLAHIYASHSNEIPVCLRSLYNYIDSHELDVRGIDLRRKTRYRKRQKTKKHKDFDQLYRINRTYKDFHVFMRDLPEDSYFELDTIVGARGSGKRILSMIQVKKQLLFLFLMPNGKAESVKRIFDYLEDLLGTEVFQELFSVFLTDNGSEFKDADGLESNEFGEIRTHVFYCDPMCSWQKPHIEKIHEYVRYVLPKGTSFKNLTQEKLTLLASHINSVKRRSMGDKCPFESLDQKKDTALISLIKKLKMHLIPADEVHLTKDLLK